GLVNMALSKYASDETGLPKWQIALAVGGTLVAGAGIYYFLLRGDSGKGKAPKTKPKKTTDSVDTSSPTSTAELEKADDAANQFSDPTQNINIFRCPNLPHFSNFWEKVSKFTP
ncbi:unnamed protein product, partial [Meganyctiphanes norvegica]